MLSTKEAFAAVMSRVLKKKSVLVRLEDSLGKILAEDIFSDLDQPPFDRVAMDGIAINSSYLKSSSKFKIQGIVSAGSQSEPLPAGPFCFEIMTGAVLPHGADMVIRYEDLKMSDGVAEIIVDKQSLAKNFHPRGSDYRCGDKIISLGTRIRSTTIALLASAGRTEVMVQGQPKISILSTGDELVSIDKIPEAHQIRWSNGITLKQELKSFGFSDVTTILVKDDESEIQKNIQACLSSSDILILTGGVSAGKFDFVPKILKENGVNEIFHKVAQRPGKPLWFGETDKGIFVFGLPGNPVSCLVNLRKFVVPFLQFSQNGKLDYSMRAELSTEVKFNKDLTFYCAVKVVQEDGKWIATPLSGNGSGDFFQLRDSDGFIELRPSEGPFLKGYSSEVYLWGETHA
ncbi:MAG: molybdopterin molybdotransferase MoeA [Bacteriovoracaceae bacterium]